MIFVTVGTHEQQFNRLIRAVDELKRDGTIDEPVIIQSGYCTYKPLYCKAFDFLPYSVMQKYMSEARIVITHGGPSSFMMAIQHGTVPIVVPRQVRYEEHVNNHQLTFCREVEKRSNNIILVEDIDDLKDKILGYSTIQQENPDVRPHNAEFTKLLQQIINKLLM